MVKLGPEIGEDAAPPGSGRRGGPGHRRRVGVPCRIKGRRGGDQGAKQRGGAGWGGHIAPTSPRRTPFRPDAPNRTASGRVVRTPSGTHAASPPVAPVSAVGAVM